MYSFREDFGNRRERMIKNIDGYNELEVFFRRAINLSQISLKPSDFIGQSKITLTITQKTDEQIEVKWENYHENGEIKSVTENFSKKFKAEEFIKITIYILRKDNSDFVIKENSANSERIKFTVNFKV